MITLEEKKLQGYKRKLLSFEKGEHKSQEVLEVNPRGQVGAHNDHSKVYNHDITAFKKKSIIVILTHINSGSVWIEDQSLTDRDEGTMWEQLTHRLYVKDVCRVPVQVCL